MTVPVEVDLQNEGDYPVDAARLVAAVEAVLVDHPQAGNANGCALSIVLADDEDVRELNLQFRGVDSATDVLSFPADEPPIQLDDEPRYLGDMIIAFPYASAQAEREGHALMDSLALLVAHGTLHLLGYDHDDLARKTQMWAAQERALKRINVPLEIVPALENAPHADTDLH